MSVDPASLPVTFVVQGSGEYEVRVVLEAEPQHNDNESQGVALRCRAIAEFEPGRKLSEDFRQLAACRLPEGSDPSAGSRGFPRLNDQGGIDKPSDAPYAVMPERMQSFIVRIRDELATAAARTMGLLRWRTADEGPFEAISTRGAFWSLDEIDWHWLPTVFEARATVSRVPDVTDAIRDDVQALIEAGTDEPLAHKLWREAWQLRQENPRSALLIAMTALEVGVKNYVGQALPDARWLLQELPAPPTHRLLADYVPTLPPPNGGSPPAVERETCDAFRHAQDLRNALAHTGHAAMSAGDLQSLLRRIRTTLWSLDAAAGFSWATSAESLRTIEGFPPDGFDPDLYSREVTVAPSGSANSSTTRAG